MAINTLTGQEIIEPTQTALTPLATQTAPIEPPLQVSPQDVYSATNIAQTTTAPIAKPNLADPYALYDFYFKSPELTAAQTEAQKLTEELNARRQATRSQVQGIGNLPENLNVLRGFQREASAKGALEEQALGENLQAKLAYLDTMRSEAANRYNISLQERANIQELIKATGGKAGISYTDTYESAISKMSKYEEKLQKEAEKKAKEQSKNAYKEELKKQLTALGKKTKGLSTKELEKKLRKYNKSALEKAQAREDQKWAMEVAKFNKSMSSGGSGENLKSSYTATEQKRMIEQALAGGEDWNSIFETFRALGIDTKEDSVMDSYLKQKFGY